MKVTSTNRIRLNIKPKNPWNLKHWFWVFDHMEICANQPWLMKENQEFTYGYISVE